jgi:Flp pilus assembly protein TadD
VLPGAVGLAPLPAIDPFAPDDDMRGFVARHVDPRASRSTRLRQLVDALTGPEAPRIEYGARTFSAGEAYRRREANCLSFTGMFVALAREAGLEARFQEVDVPPDWNRNGASFVLNRHVNALVSDGTGRGRVVDFDMADFRASYDRRPVSDARAMAHYHGNLGVERLQAGESLEALRHFRRAIELDSQFAPAWVNLGTLYQRAGEPRWAASAWHHALEVSPAETVALSNLERLYRAEGRIELAQQLHRRAERHRMGNPYYRLFLAQAALGEGDYTRAIGHLRFAVREKPEEDRFAALLGLSYLRAGDPRQAERWLEQAARLAGDEPLRSRYSAKLERLRSAG